MPEGVAGTDWSSEELDLIVADYFAMLRDEQTGSRVNKTEHRRALTAHLSRSESSIEFKHRNISAVLTQLGLPRINGYFPAWNYQGAIATAIGRYLEQRPDPIPLVVERPTSLAEPRSLFESPPPKAPPTGARARQAFERVARRFDPALRDQANRALGQAGEELVYERERRALIEADRQDLARKVKWVSREEGDGLGYDIRSFDSSGGERWIEVKTTRGGSLTPFYLTRNENEVAMERPDAFRLYRLHDFSSQPGLFTLTPPLDTVLRLEALTFRASLK